MRKSHLVIQPGVRSLTQIGALLLFLACPNIAFVGRDRQDIQPACSFSTMSLKWLQKKPESEFLRHLDPGFLITAYEPGNENDYEQMIINGDKHSMVPCGDNESISFQREITVPCVNLLLSTSLQNDTSCGNKINSLPNEIHNREQTVFPSVKNLNIFRSIVNEKNVKRNVNKFIKEQPLEGRQELMPEQSRLPIELRITRTDLHQSNNRRTSNVNTRENRETTRRTERSKQQDRLPHFQDSRDSYRYSRNEIRQNEVNRKIKSSNLLYREMQPASLNSVNSFKRSFDPRTLEHSKTHNLITKQQLNRREQNIYPIRLMEAYRFDSKTKVESFREDSRFQPRLKRHSREFLDDSNYRYLMSRNVNGERQDLENQEKTTRDSWIQKTVLQNSRNEVTELTRIGISQQPRMSIESQLDARTSINRIPRERRGFPSLFKSIKLELSSQNRHKRSIQTETNDKSRRIGEIRNIIGHAVKSKRNQQFRDFEIERSTFRDDRFVRTDSDESSRRNSFERQEERSVTRREARSDSGRTLNDHYRSEGRRESIDTRRNQPFRDSRIEQPTFRDDTFIRINSDDTSRRNSFERREEQSVSRREARSDSGRALNDHNRREGKQESIDTRRNQQFRDSRIEQPTFRGDTFIRTNSDDTSRRNSFERREEQSVLRREARSDSRRALNDQNRREGRRESIDTRRNQQFRDSRIEQPTFRDDTFIRTNSDDTSRRNSFERREEQSVSRREARSDSGRALNDHNRREGRRESIDTRRNQQLRDSRIEQPTFRDDTFVRTYSDESSRRNSIERQEERSVSRREARSDSGRALDDQYRRNDRRESIDYSRRNQQFRDSRNERSTFRDDTLVRADSDDSLRRNSFGRQEERSVSRIEARSDSGRALDDQYRRNDRRESIDNSRRNQHFRDSRIERSTFRDETLVRADSDDSLRRNSFGRQEERSVSRREARSDSGRALDDQYRRNDRRESIDNSRRNQHIRDSRIERSTFRDDTLVRADSDDSLRRNSFERREEQSVSRREARSDSGRALNDHNRREGGRESIDNSRRNQQFRDSRIEQPTFRNDKFIRSNSDDTSRRNSLERREEQSVSRREARSDSGHALNEHNRREGRRESIDTRRNQQFRDSRIERSTFRDDTLVRAVSDDSLRRNSFERQKERSVLRREARSDSGRAINDQYRRDDRRESIDNSRRKQQFRDFRIEKPTFRDDTFVRTYSDESSRRNSIEQQEKRSIPRRVALKRSERSINDQYRRDDRRESIDNSRRNQHFRDSRIERSTFRDDTLVRADSDDSLRRNSFGRQEERSVSRREARSDSGRALDDQYRRNDRRESIDNSRRNQHFRDARIERTIFRDGTFVQTDFDVSSRMNSIEPREERSVSRREEALTYSRGSLNDQYRRNERHESIANSRRKEQFRKARIERAAFRDDTFLRTDSDEFPRRNSIERREKRSVSRREALSDSGRTLNDQYRRDDRRDTLFRLQSHFINKIQEIDYPTARRIGSPTDTTLFLTVRHEKSVGSREASLSRVFRVERLSNPTTDIRTNNIAFARGLSYKRREKQAMLRRENQMNSRPTRLIQDGRFELNDEVRNKQNARGDLRLTNYRESSFQDDSAIHSNFKFSFYRELHFRREQNCPIVTRRIDSRINTEHLILPRQKRFAEIERMRKFYKDLRTSRDLKVSRLSFRNDRRVFKNRPNSREDVRLGSKLLTTYQQHRDVKREEFDNFRRIQRFSNNLRIETRRESRLSRDLKIQDDPRLLNQEVSEENQPISRRVSRLDTRLNKRLVFRRDSSLSSNVRRNGNERRESINIIRKSQTDDLLHDSKSGQSRLLRVSVIDHDNSDNRRVSQRVSGELLVSRQNRFRGVPSIHLSSRLTYQRVSTKRQELESPGVTHRDDRLNIGLPLIFYQYQNTRRSSNNNFRRMQTFNEYLSGSEARDRAVRSFRDDSVIRSDNRLLNDHLEYRNAMILNRIDSRTASKHQKRNVNLDSRSTVNVRHHRNTRRDSRESIMQLYNNDLRYAAKLQSRFSDISESRHIRSSFRDSPVVRSEPSLPTRREFEGPLSRLSRAIMTHEFGERNNIRLNTRLSTKHLQRDVRSELFDKSRIIQQYNNDLRRGGRSAFRELRVTRMSPDESAVRSEARLISQRVSGERQEFENQARTNRISLPHILFDYTVSRLTARRVTGRYGDSRMSRLTSRVGSVIQNMFAKRKAFELKRIQTFTDSLLAANRDSKVSRDSRIHWSLVYDDFPVHSKSKISNLRMSDERQEYENAATRRNVYRRDNRLDTIYQERRNNDLTLLPQEISNSEMAIDLAFVIQILGTLLFAFLSSRNSKHSFMDKFGWMVPKSFDSNLLDSSKLTYALKC